MPKWLRYIASVCTLSVSIITSGQTTYYVIAPSGLNIREAPSLQARIVGKLPFLTKVNTVDNHVYGVDTLRWVHNYGCYDLEVNGEYHYGIGDRPLVGHWRKVSQNEQEGYVIDTYLSQGGPRGDTLSLASVQYIDRNTTQWRIHYNYRNYNWYYIQPFADSVRLVPTAIDMVAGISEYSGAMIETVYDNAEMAVGVIGFKNGGGANSRKLDFYQNAVGNVFVFTLLDQAELTVHGLTAAWTKSDVNIYYTTWQNEPIYIALSGELAGNPRLKLIADLDSDGQKDFIFYTYVKGADIMATALALSTDIRNGVYLVSAYSYLDYD